MAGSQLCPNCGMSVGINEDTCDTCRMYETGRSDARLTPILALIACWAIIPIFTGLVLSYMGSNKRVSLGSARHFSEPKIAAVEMAATVTAGQWTTVRVEIGNPGCNAYGQLRLRFPTLAAASDSEKLRLISCSEGDLPGVRLIAPGTPVQHKNGRPVLARHWVLEFTDYSWRAEETNVVELKVKPAAAGRFPFQVGAALGAYGKPWYEIKGATTGPDEQGWHYKEYVMVVLPTAE